MPDGDRSTPPRPPRTPRARRSPHLVQAMQNAAFGQFHPFILSPSPRPRSRARRRPSEGSPSPSPVSVRVVAKVELLIRHRFPRRQLHPWVQRRHSLLDIPRPFPAIRQAFLQMASLLGLSSHPPWNTRAWLTPSLRVLCSPSRRRLVARLSVRML